MYPVLELLVEKQIIAPDSDVLDIKSALFGVYILWGISVDIRSISVVTTYLACRGIHYTRHYRHMWKIQPYPKDWQSNV